MNHAELDKFKGTPDIMFQRRNELFIEEFQKSGGDRRLYLALITAHFTQKEKWISMFFNYSEAWVRSEFDRYMENCKNDEERSKLQKAFNDSEEHLMK